MNTSKRKNMTKFLDPTPRVYSKNPRVPDFFTPKYYDPARSISPGKIKGLYNYFKRNPAKLGGLVGSVSGVILDSFNNENFGSPNSGQIQSNARGIRKKTYKQYKKRSGRKRCTCC